jgi:hypothetical protein
LARFVVFGSFVTAKRELADVDVFLLMGDDFDASRLTGEVDRMQLEVREYLSLHPTDLKATA